MFCTNCGAQQSNQAKFCSNCGQNLNNVEASTSNNASCNQGIKISETEKILHQHFKDNNEFGSALMVVGKTPIPKNLHPNIRRYCDGENPLLVFNYCGKDCSEGFIVTDDHIIFNFGSSKQISRYRLNDIEGIGISKSVLADVMTLYFFDGNKSSKIYLTGLRNVQRFGMKFQDFVTDLNYITEDDSDATDSEVSGIEFLESILVKSIGQVKIDSMYCETGFPMDQATSKKYLKAAVNFNIPRDENIFLIFDATIIGACDKGFAICTTGLYLCEKPKDYRYIAWDKILNINISYGFTGLKVGPFVFNAGGGDGKKLEAILKGIKDDISIYI